MNNRRSSAGIILIGIILLALAGTLGWANYRFTAAYPVSNDFLTQWTAFRVFAREGLSPYSDQAEQEAEQIVYGHLAQGSEDKLRFSLPFYAGFFILPFSMIADPAIARAIWMAIMEILLVSVVFLGLRVTDYKPKGWMLGLILIFAVLGFPSFQALATGNLVILALFWIVLALLAMRSGRFEVAGIVFSFATVYPKSMLLLGIFLVVWSWSKKNWSVVFWYMVGIVFLSLLSFFLLQDWIVQYARLLWQARDFSTSLTTGKVLSAWMPGPGRQIGVGLSVLVGLILVVEWLAATRKEFRWVMWTACLTLAISPWVGLPVQLADLVLLVLPLILTLSVLDERFGVQGHWMAAFLLCLLLAGFWLLYLRAVSSPAPQPAIDALIFPMPFFVLIGMYWVRWWAIRPVRTFIEDLRSSRVI